MQSDVNAPPKVALLDYYTTNDEIMFFLIKKDLKEPLVFRTRINYKDYVTTSQYLNLCVQRLLIDFNGLSPSWNKISSSHVPLKKIEDSLKLEPEIPPYMRFRDPNYPGHLLMDPDYKFEEIAYFQRLSNILFPSEAKEYLNDCDVLCISPHGSLHSLPFHALKWNDNQYVIERFGICYVPSASTLVYCQAKNVARKNPTNPKYRPTKCAVVCSGTKDDYEQFEEDIDIITKLKWDSVIPLRALESTKDNVVSKIVNNDVIHFATHGFFTVDSSQDPLESGLLLTPDGGLINNLDSVMTSKSEERLGFFITAREIFNTQLNANLVTLRACSSGRSNVVSGDEVIGLTRAFLYAGTPSLLVSLWNVNIQSSKMLLSKFYELWLDTSKPLQKWKALQQAQIYLMKKEKKYSHPYHWAPILLIGDWI